MIIRKSSFYIIVTILLVAIYGTLELSITDFQNKDVCPKIMDIPACYLVLLLFVLVLLSHTIRKIFVRDTWYFIFIFIPFLMALSGTLTELSGTEVCPRTSDGIPMCFISLGICTALVLFKIIELKSVHRTTR